MPDLFHIEKAGVSLAEEAAPQVLMIRLRKPGARTLADLQDLLGVALPTIPNRAAQGGAGQRAIWVGPEEWMIVGTAPSPDAFAQATKDAVVALMVDVTDGRYAMEASGPYVRDFLALAVPIDLDPSVLGIDDTAMTLFTHLPVVVDHVAPDLFRLWFDISLRHYVRSWSLDALAGLAPVPEALR